MNFSTLSKRHMRNHIPMTNRQMIKRSRSILMQRHALNKEEFNRVSIATKLYQILHTLQVTHEGTNKIKKSKISILMRGFELFKMKQNKTIIEMIT